MGGEEEDERREGKGKGREGEGKREWRDRREGRGVKVCGTGWQVQRSSLRLLAERFRRSSMGRIARGAPQGAHRKGRIERGATHSAVFAPIFEEVHHHTQIAISRVGDFGPERV